MSEAALKAKSIAAERKAFVAATFAYESGAKLQNIKREVVNGDVDLSKLTTQVRMALYFNILSPTAFKYFDTKTQSDPLGNLSEIFTVKSKNIL
jgi:hypothetical protein